MWKKTLLIGLALLGVGLVASKVIFPSYVTSPHEARARVLATDVATLRAIVGQYTLDIGKRPQSLEELLKAGYIKKIPPDPLSGRTDTSRQRLHHRDRRDYREYTLSQVLFPGEPQR